MESDRRRVESLPNWDEDENDDLINRNLPNSILPPQVVFFFSCCSKEHLFFQWVESKKTDGNVSAPIISLTTIEDQDRARLRIQDKELIQMTDDGMCLSMHQPWASLLVRGIKLFVLMKDEKVFSNYRTRFRHEGRTWYTAHRGRLWIHAAAKSPSDDEIAELELFYRNRSSPSEQFDFPSEYPTSVLLGCVDVVDCLDRQTYSEQFPDGESDSDFVLICENPQELAFKIPMRGQHKICKKDQHFNTTCTHSSLPVSPYYRCTCVCVIKCVYPKEVLNIDSSTCILQENLREKCLCQYHDKFIS